MEKQLNVWIDSQLKDTLNERASQEKKSLKQLVEEILTQDTARYQAQQIERQALPIINAAVQKVIRGEMKRHLTRLEAELHEYFDEKFTSINAQAKFNNNVLKDTIPHTT